MLEPPRVLYELSARKVLPREQILELHEAASSLPKGKRGIESCLPNTSVL